MTPLCAIGDSNIFRADGFPEWPVAFPNCLNYGTAGITAKDFRAAYITDGAGVGDRANFPASWDLSGNVLLMLGTNDINTAGETAATISTNIMAIESIIRRDMTNGLVYVCEIIPRFFGGLPYAEQLRIDTNAALRAKSYNQLPPVFEVPRLILSDYIAEPGGGALHLNNSGMAKFIAAVQAA